MRTVTAALLLAAALPLGSADATHFLDRLAEPVEHCRYSTFNQETVTGSNMWEGYAYGYAVRGPLDQVSISCVVKVNGVEAARVDGDTTPAAAAVVGRLTFAATDTDDIRLCRVVTVNGVATETCPGPTYGPPEDWSMFQPFFDHLYEASVAADGVYCPVLGEYAGTYGPVTVEEGGDVYYEGELFWDCYPYAWPAP